jgi:large subunit ribosomal protein L17
MRHGMVNRKLGRTSAHRLAMFRNQFASLLDKERIVTTLPKAKELRPQIERLITLARNDSQHTRRIAAKSVQDPAMVAKLFDTIGPRFANTPGGYTRIIKLGPRRGDAAEMAILEFVGFELSKDDKAEPAAPAKGGKKKAAASEEKAEAAPAEGEKAKRPRKAAAKKDEDAAAGGDEKPKRPRKKKEE